jgi:hypothetical protein
LTHECNRPDKAGWDEEKFSDAERSELARMGCPFMKGEVSDSIRITLTPNVK